MGNLSKNFSRWEFECKCGCGRNAIDYQLINIMQCACNHFAKVLKVKKVYAQVNSGNRCPAHNKSELALLGLPDNDSKHKCYIAADWYIKNVPVIDLYNWVDENFGEEVGLGLYDNRIHLDVRGYRARWEVK